MANVKFKGKGVALTGTFPANGEQAKAFTFCGAEGIENVTMASTFRSPAFMSDYGVTIAQGSLKNLAARAVICIDEQGKVIYSELVDDITHEPDCQVAMDSLT